MQKTKPESKKSVQKHLKRRPGIKPNYSCQTKGLFYNIPQSQIYETLEQNLIEEGCHTAARYFKQLVHTENELFKANARFKKRVRDSHCLLLAAMENIKSAENAFRALGEKDLTLRLLIQTVHMIQAQDENFVWLVKELYKIVIHVSKGWEDTCMETLSRVHFEYGVILAEKGEDDLDESIAQLSKSLETCRGTLWYSNEMDRSILHEEVCKKLGETLLRKAKINYKFGSKISSELACRAAAVLAEVPTREGPNLYCSAKLRQCEYLSKCSEYESAFKILKDLEKHIMANNCLRNKCEFYFWLGVCHFNLSPPNIGLALKKLNLSLSLSNDQNFADLKAEALLYLGKIHAKNAATQEEARQCFIEAKNLFRELRDFENEKLVKCLMAQIRAYQVYPNYMELIQKASTNSFCYLYDLLQWKLRLLPFWNDDGKLKHSQDGNQCGLEDYFEGERSNSRK